MKLHPKTGANRRPRAACLEPLEDRLLMTRVQGLDVSYFQGTAQSPTTHINWTSVRNAGYQFTMIRSSYGYASADADIAYNATNALAAGMYVSFYHYAYYNSSTSNTGKAEADNFFNRTKTYLAMSQYQDHLLQPMLDIEEGPGVITSDGTLVNWINNFTTELRAKYATLATPLYPTPLIYMSASHATLTSSGGYFEDSTPAVNYPLVVAQYPSTLPNPQTAQPSSNGIWINGGTLGSTSFYQSWAFWQYTSSKVVVPGINGNVDMDVFQGDLASLQNYVLPKTTGPVSGRFSIGSTLKAAVAGAYYPTSQANTAPSGTIPANTTGTVLQGPIYGGSFVRYQVAFSNGVTGWVGDYQTVTTTSPFTVTDWLTKTVVTNVTSPTVNGSYKAGTLIPVTVTFNNPVTVTGTPQLTLQTTSGTTTNVNYASGSGTNVLTFNYTVAAGNTSSDLNYASNTSLVFNNGLIADADGDIATLNLPLTTAAGSLGANKAIVIDTTAPTVTNVTSALANGAYPAGTVVPITVTFSEPVNVTGTPRLALNTGALANYSGGSGTTTLTFAYTVAAGQNIADLNYTATNSLTLNAGTILDAALNPATLTLPAPTAAGSLGTNKAIVVDTTPPAINNVTSAAANGGYNAGSVITITLTFSEPVLVTGTPRLTLNNGAVANYASGSGTTALTFNYTVAAAGDDVAELDYADTASLSLNGGTIKDLATNAATLTLPAPGAAGSLSANANLTVDTLPPTVASAPPTPTRGAATLDLPVTYADALIGVDATSVGTGDLLVTGPSGFSQSPSLVSFNASTGLATYRLTAPGGSWDESDDGAYTISQVASQVLDLAGNARPADTLASFAVNFPPFAHLDGSTLTLDNFDTALITLAATGTDLTATQGANSYTFPASSVAAITLNTAAGDDTLTLSGAITAPLAITGAAGPNDKVTLAGGATCQITCTPGYSFTVLSGASLALPASAQLASLTINGGTVTLPTTGTTLTTSNLSITGGTLDLRDNALTWDYTGPSPIDTLRSYLQAGRISSSLATPQNHMSLGYLENSDLGTLGAPGVDATALLVKYTYAGDANLDGRIDADDYAITDRGFAKGITNAHWGNGDYDYSGTLDQSDYLLLDSSTAALNGPPSPSTLAAREASFGPAYVQALLAPAAPAPVVTTTPPPAPTTFSDAPITPTTPAPVAPVATITAPKLPIRKNKPATFKLSVPNLPAARFTYRIDWDNDGTPDQTFHGPSSLSIPHKFAKPGKHTITLLVTDDATGLTSNPLTLSFKVL